MALGLGAGAAGLAAVAGAAQAGATAEASVDVVIVGAGFAGLTAARRLKGAGRSVAVLEADDRVGGRTKAGKIAGEVVDLGGQWLGPGQNRLIALAKEFGATVYPQYTAGNNIIDIAGRRATYKGEIPDLGPAALAEFATVMGKIDALAAKTPAARPWEAPGAAELDAQTVETWLLANTTIPAVGSALRLLIRTLACLDAGQVSMLALVGFAASAGSFSYMIATRGGAQDSLVQGGVWQLAAKMAAGLGDAVVLNAPVTSIAQDDSGVVVSAGDRRWRGRYVIVTAPPPLAGRIQYRPPLPSSRDGLTQRMPLGSIIKVHIAYARPFWREQGFSGLVLSDRTDFGPWFDHSPETGAGGLVGFFAGVPAQRWSDRSPAERRAQALKDIAVYLGEAALSPTDYVEEVWNNAQWHRGGYLSVPGPGVMTAFGPAIRAPIGRIHWAGTETADTWSGYVDGAIGAGEESAKTVGGLL